MTKFLKRPTNSGKVKVTGKRVNRGAGYGLELPCEYLFYGDKFSFEWLKKKKDLIVNSCAVLCARLLGEL